MPEVIQTHIRINLFGLVTVIAGNIGACVSAARPVGSTQAPCFRTIASSFLFRRHTRFNPLISEQEQNLEKAKQRLADNVDLAMTYTRLLNALQIVKEAVTDIHGVWL